MTSTIKLRFTEFCINGCILPVGEGGYCKVLEGNKLNHLAFRVNESNRFVLEMQDSLLRFQYSSWDEHQDLPLILDFTLSLTSIPPWMEKHLKSLPGCGWDVVVSLKAKCSRSSYEDFIDAIISPLASPQYNRLKKEELLVLWEDRCNPKPIHTVKGVKFLPSLFVDFSLVDLERLKDDKQWLSDSHVTLALLDCYNICHEKKIWGRYKIKLLDTSFWSSLSNQPGKFNAKYRNRVNLMDCDFAVMPMHAANHWRLGIIEKPAELIEGKTVLHILDSLPGIPTLHKEAHHLQKILLKHFNEETFKEGRIIANVPQVPTQPNSVDCACYAIYFGKKFFENPEGTMALINSTISSQKDILAAWGLEGSDITFIRRELVKTLFKYVSRGDATVEYND